MFSTIEKTLSFAYRIILSRGIGAEGLGIYQIALSVFSVLLTAASSGVPVTVSRLITKQNALSYKYIDDNKIDKEKALNDKKEKKIKAKNNTKELKDDS